ncbi:MAG TPA: lamin tail domain-containing protein [Candidatus Methanofastidiosa archaeon]|nr:lamin tail domain-containing protein [Candidatus Methanofastidiosa archaeon]HPR41890.1 lamin tail domain-containing protein [Candidatus Methanofastidiosa archaeon]
MKGTLIISLLLLSMLSTLPIGQIDCTESGGLVINEIMFNPGCVLDSRGEWFELYNPTDSLIELRGWSFTDGGGDLFIVQEEISIPSKEYLVFGRNDDPLSNGGVNVDYKYSGMYLANGGDTIMVVDPQGNVIDNVDYSLKGFPSESGSSIELRNPSLDNSHGRNWSISTHDNGAGDNCTPGCINSCHEEEVIGTSTIPIIAFELMLDGRLGNEWISSLTKEDDSYDKASPVQEETVATTEHSMSALFCDNKGQYYDNSKAKMLYSLLDGLDIGTRTLSDGPIEPEHLEGIDLLIITNPQSRFDDEELGHIDDYLESGGKLLLTGQYFKYIYAEALNDISAKRGILFTYTEIIDDESNTGSNYYPRILIDLDGKKEVNIANSCALCIVDGNGLIYCEDSSRVVDADDHHLDMASCVAALTGDGSILCIGTSSIVTTTLYRADNFEVIRKLIECLLFGGL